MQHMRYAFLMAGIAAALSGCSSAFPDTPQSSLSTSSVNTPEFVFGLPKGYECPLIPNGLDPAGSIYRLDKSGTYYRVKDFSQDAAITSLGNYKRVVPISNYALNDSQKSNAGLSFNLLKTALPGLSANASADLKKEIEVEITVQEIVAEVIDDVVADRIVEQFEKTVTPKSGSKYYLVRESVRAGSVSYRLKQTDLAKMGGKAQVEKLAEGSANVTMHDNDGTFEIKQKFAPEPMPICVKSAEIVVANTPAASGATVSASLKSAEDTTVPTIKRVGEN